MDDQQGVGDRLDWGNCNPVTEKRIRQKEQIIATLADERHEREERIIDEGLKRGDTAASLCELFASFYESLTEPKARKERRVGVHLWAEAL